MVLSKKEFSFSYLNVRTFLMVEEKLKFVDWFLLAVFLVQVRQV